MKTIPRILFTACLLLLAAPATWAADIIYVKPLELYADKTTLSLEWTKYQDPEKPNNAFNPAHLALKIFFGSGKAERGVLLVFEETVNDSMKTEPRANLLKFVRDSELQAVPAAKELSATLGLRLLKQIPQ